MSDRKDGPANPPAQSTASPPPDAVAPAAKPRVPEQGGPRGLEPTRYGDWERDGRCVDF
jgi:hypothetical protein